MKKDYRTGLPRGYGFIKMKTLEDQEKVLKEGDFYIDGRMAQVSGNFVSNFFLLCFCINKKSLSGKIPGSWTRWRRPG